MILFLDTETTGIGPQARVIQIAMDLCREDGTTVATLNTIVNQEVPSHPKAIEVHGITDEIQATGLDKYIAGNLVGKIANEAGLIIGHNIPFDIDMIGQSFMNVTVSHKASYCTMRNSTNVCKIPSARGLKWPKLVEAYRFLFEEDFENAHDAWADVQACKRVYFRLKEMGL